MNIIETENIKLKEKIIQLEDKIKEYEEKMKKYTNSEAHKKYYQEHKEEVKIKGLNYLKKLKEENPEKIKEYRRKAYIKEKEKKLNLSK